MNHQNHTTELAFILDRSGSMRDCQQAAVDGFNRFLADQQKVAGHARLTLVLFDHEYLRPIHAMPVAEVLPLSEIDYVPRGYTALLDAIGKTIDDLGTRLAAMAEADRPRQVIIAILTDGLENASERFSWKQIAARIKEQTEKYAWNFLFLGANQDAIATAAQISIAAENSATYTGDVHGALASQVAFSRKAGAMRLFSSGAPLSQQQTADLAAPLTELVAEEDKKARSDKKTEKEKK